MQCEYMFYYSTGCLLLSIFLTLYSGRMIDKSKKHVSDALEHLKYADLHRKDAKAILNKIEAEKRYQKYDAS